MKKAIEDALNTLDADEIGGLYDKFGITIPEERTLFSFMEKLFEGSFKLIPESGGA